MKTPKRRPFCCDCTRLCRIFFDLTRLDIFIANQDEQQENFKISRLDARRNAKYDILSTCIAAEIGNLLFSSIFFLGRKTSARAFQPMKCKKACAIRPFNQSAGDKLLCTTENIFCGLHNGRGLHCSNYGYKGKIKRTIVTKTYFAFLFTRTCSFSYIILFLNHDVLL